MKKGAMKVKSRFAKARRCVGVAGVCASVLAPSIGLAQKTYSYGNGSTLPATQQGGLWSRAGVWHDGGSWGDWMDGGIARFYSPVAGPSATLTLDRSVRLGGLVKEAEGEHFTALNQAGHAIDFAEGARISVNRGTLATQGGVLKGGNLLLCGTKEGALRIGPMDGEAPANQISGLTLETITLKLSKNNGVAAVGGNVVINSGVLEHGSAFNNRRDNQYAAGSTLTLNGGTVSYWSTAQSLDSFAFNGGTFTIWANANLNLLGTEALTLRNVALRRTGGQTGEKFFVNLARNGAQTVRFDAAGNGMAILGEGAALVLGGGVKTFHVENGGATTDLQVLVESITEAAPSSIRKTGGGMAVWNVLGANACTGGMTVEQGILCLVSPPALPAGGVTVANRAVLGLRMYDRQFGERQFEELHAGTLYGVTMGAAAFAGWETHTEQTLGTALTGTRGLAKLGGGKLILTGENAYTGGTLIHQGNLQIGNGGTTGSIAGNVYMNAASDSFRQLIFNRSDVLTYDGNIIGSGSVRNDGKGTVVLTGAHNYIGATMVAAGTLLINGSTAPASAVTVAANAAVGGRGTLGGSLTLQKGARLVFDPVSGLKVGGQIMLDRSFGINALVNPEGAAVDWSVIRDGTYTLVSTSGAVGEISNSGIENAVSLGDGRRAFFKKDGLQLVVTR